MSAIAAERSHLMRWALSAALVIGLHAAGAAALLAWHDPVGMDDESSAVVVDLSPYVPPSKAIEDLAPGPLQQQAAAPAPEQQLERKDEPKPEETVEAKPEEKVETKIEPAPQEKIEVPPAPVPPVAALPPPAAVAPPPPPEPEAQPAPPSDTPPAPVTTAPPREQPAASAAINKWYKEIVEQIERHKAYAAAHARGLKGVVKFAFSIDRQGRVVSSRVAETSGDAAVDRAALATLEKAQPFPPPPAGMRGDAFPFTMPLKFRTR
jgi:protein TonB